MSGGLSTRATGFHIVLRWLSDGPDKPLFVEIREAAEFSRFVNTVRLRGRLPRSAVRAGGTYLTTDLYAAR